MTYWVSDLLVQEPKSRVHLRPTARYFSSCKQPLSNQMHSHDHHPKRTTRPGPKSLTKNSSKNILESAQQQFKIKFLEKIMKIPYHSRFDDSNKKTVKRPAGIQGVSNLWVLLWVWLPKMNNVASSNSFSTSESSFCPPSGFARDFVDRTWSGGRGVFCRHLEVKRAWKVRAGSRVQIWWNQEILNGLGSSADIPDFHVKIQSKFGDFGELPPDPLHFVIL